MNCIKCHGVLETKNIDGIEVDQCPNCSGIWFDFGELDELLGESDISALKNRIANNEGHDQMDANCPRCGGNGKLVRVVSPQDSAVHIDTCLVCYGQWLDGGELETLKGGEISIMDLLTWTSGLI